jgi:soluble lytic murein transglycosylase
MKTKRRVGVVVGVVVAGLLVSGAPPSNSQMSAPAAVEGAPAQSTPASGDAFADGYRAFRANDHATAAERLRVAVQSDPVLADYALYFLGRTQQAENDLAGAAASFTQLVHEYPASVLAPHGELELAQVQFALHMNGDAFATAAHLIATASEESLERKARLVEARALAAGGNYRIAYDHVMQLRHLYPHSDEDGPARTLAYELLTQHPGMVATDTLDYHHDEAALLLEEGQLSDARMQAEAALAMSPSSQVRAELMWIEARSLKPEPEQQRAALLRYLRFAPSGPDAPKALEALGLLYWHEDDYANAIASFAKVAARFPSSKEAPGALYRIGRVYEEEKKFEAARAAYRRLDARYPESDNALDGRFRIGWTYYMARRYAEAAAAFTRGHAREPLDRDMFVYWHARALEKNGEGEAARAEYQRLAETTDSNYYPELASMRLGGNVAVDLPAASAPDPAYAGVPRVSASAENHLARWQALNALGLRDLEPYELEAIESKSGGLPGVRIFVLAGLDRAGAWSEAIQQATLMQKRGQLESDVAERVRYPRAYWDLFRSAAEQRSLDPWLVLALARQESLFNPYATSVSNARGLMQLIPSTARKVAPEAGVNPEDIQLYDPSVNVALGTTYLRNLTQLFHGNEFHVVAAYNGGEHAVQKWLAKYPGDDDEWVENIGYSQTRDYVKKVIGGRREYHLLYQQKSPASASRGARQSSG